MRYVSSGPSVETLQAMQDKNITEHIGRNPNLHGQFQAQILLSDFDATKHNPSSLENVEINARASQKALDKHSDEMSVEVRTALQSSIDLVLNNNIKEKRETLDKAEEIKNILRNTESTKEEILKAIEELRAQAAKL